jgi:energy-coupling factor transporter ATP-binding protein EcfA2
LILVFTNKQSIIEMARRYSMRRGSDLKPNPNCPIEQEVNILLLGQTGVGKTTFINAFANYLVHNTLEQADKDEMQIIIPSSFFFTMPDTFDDKRITLGNRSEDEKFVEVGQSDTQSCRSFVFPIGDRNLRFIDTPGIGDTRGLEQDTKNFQEIMNYIAQYEHLNAVCILLKPNEERMTILFRFCINELLRHLHVGVSENLIFVFTNARLTFFMPGTSKQLLQKLLDKHREDYNVEVPFSKKNSFLLDNEPFRYLALRKHGIYLNEEQTRSYSNSWNISVEEYGRLMEHIVSCPLHAVSNTLSLNEAEQLVRKLARPIAETAKLIEENIQLANDYKKRVLENPQIASQGIPQNNATVIPLRHPQTVCVGEKCCRVIDDGDEKKVEYLHICHDECYLKGVTQETLYDPKLEDCTAMNPRDGKLLIVCFFLYYYPHEIIKLF